MIMPAVFICSSVSYFAFASEARGGLTTEKEKQEERRRQKVEANIKHGTPNAELQ
jgi:hypothetical protein